MIKTAWLALLLLLPLPVAAQTADPAQTAAAAPTPTAPPVGAMLHHQPDQSEVMQREDKRYGDLTVKRLQTPEQIEVDKLYDEVMRRSAPSNTSHP